MTKLDRVNRVRKEADELRVQGAPLKAVALLRAARKEWPDKPNILTDLATCYVSVPDFAMAEKCLLVLLEWFPDNDELLIFAAELRGSMRRLGASLATYETVSRLNPRSSVAWLKSAEIFERQNRLDDSRACLEHALRLDPKSAQARLREAVLLTRENRFDEAAKSLVDLLQSGLTDREVHWKSGHQLASVMDKMGDFTGASQVWKASKQGMEVNYATEIRKAREAFAHKSALIRKLTNDLTPARIKSWSDSGSCLTRPHILAGHPRSGTTLLETILNRHRMLVSVEEIPCLENEIFRSVYGAAAAKPELFDAGFLDGISIESRRMAGSCYRRATAQFIDGEIMDRLILDKNPMLTHFLGVALRFFPQLKALILIRDPRDVCLSCYQQPVGVVTSNVSWLKVEDVMNSYQDIMGVWVRLREILPDSWHEVRYERLVNDTDTEARRAVAFLGLPWQEDVLNSEKDERTIFSPTYAEATQPVYRTAVNRWQNYGDLLNPHLPLLDEVIRELGYD